MWQPRIRGGRRTAALQMLFPSLGGIGVGLGLVGTGATGLGLAFVVFFSLATVALLLVIRRSN